MGVHVATFLSHDRHVIFTAARYKLHRQQIDSVFFGVMVDVLEEGAGVYPVEADVRVLSAHPLESPNYPLVSQASSRFGDYIDESQLAYTTVPDPLKLRGVGNTTL